MNIYIFLKNIRKVIMRLAQIFKHYHSCPETVLFFIFFIEWMTCLPTRITRFFGSVFYVDHHERAPLFYY